MTLKTIAAAAALAAGLNAPAHAATQAELEQKVEQLAAELAELKAQLAQLRQAPNSSTSAAASPASAPAPVVSTPAPASAQAEAARPAAEPATVLTSYGEINYNRPTHAGEQAQADLRRFVLGLQHRFDERTKMVAELEVEHAVASADDAGEVEVEQAYVERQFDATWSGRAGLFLVPMGLLNENHEPTAYYGVERNFVETAIIPSTWREGGVQAIGSFDNGLTLQAGLSTGFDIGKWDYSADSEGRQSPLGSIHQEMQLARSHDLALFGALNWRGTPGLLLGGGFFTGQASQAQPGVPSSRISLWDVHGRWTPGRWDLSALYAQGSIGNTAALNLLQVGNPTPIPSRFDGGYVQAAYQLWRSGERSLSPFARWEEFNTARRFEDIGAGLTAPAQPTERVVTVGANFQLTPEVVFKADVQRFRQNPDADRFDLGLGWSF